MYFTDISRLYRLLHSSDQLIYRAGKVIILVLSLLLISPLYNSHARCARSLHRAIAGVLATWPPADSEARQTLTRVTVAFLFSSLLVAGPIIRQHGQLISAYSALRAAVSLSPLDICYLAVTSSEMRFNEFNGRYNVVLTWTVLNEIYAPIIFSHQLAPCSW